jgi:dipeptidyl-peptidase 4
MDGLSAVPGLPQSLEARYKDAVKTLLERADRLCWQSAGALGLTAGLLATAGVLAADAPTNSARLTVDRISDAEEFKAEAYGGVVWRAGRPGYWRLETAENTKDGKDLVRYVPPAWRKEIVVPAHAFIPPGESAPLALESFEFAADEARVLLYTNSKRVWRQKSRGDYWVLDVATHELKKLGGDAAPATLQFARFSPDGTRVAYVREHDLYTQNLRDWEITALTTNGSPALINGTFDWVYEEELGLHDGFRWSPDGQSLAFWQLDLDGVRDFYLLNNTDGLYPEPRAFPYPKAGETIAAARIGVVGAQGGDPRWLELPGDPRQHYLARMDWASNSTELVVQQFHRRQNTNRVFSADAATGQARAVLTETDAAWVDNHNATRWLDRGRQFLWLSERDGWRQAYRVSRDGRQVTRITRGAFDVMSVDGVDERKGWLYFSASPDNPTQRYLYRARLAGGKAERLTPASQPGTHSYHFSPDARWAIHTLSSFTRPPLTELIRLPSHATVRVLEDKTTRCARNWRRSTNR